VSLEKNFKRREAGRKSVSTRDWEGPEKEFIAGGDPQALSIGKKRRLQV